MKKKERNKIQLLQPEELLQVKGGRRPIQEQRVASIRASRWDDIILRSPQGNRPNGEALAQNVEKGYHKK